VLFVGYLLVLLALPVSLAERSGLVRPLHVESGLPLVLTVTVASFVWRAMMRGLFTAREYGWAEGLRAVLRIPVANVIVMMAARRALAAYVRSLRGAPLQWDKTMHHALPAALLTRSQPA
jgi:adsorption protein B